MLDNLRQLGRTILGCVMLAVMERQDPQDFSVLAGDWHFSLIFYFIDILDVTAFSK